MTVTTTPLDFTACTFQAVPTRVDGRGLPILGSGRPACSCTDRCAAATPGDPKEHRVPCPNCLNNHARLELLPDPVDGKAQCPACHVTWTRG